MAIHSGSRRRHPVPEGALERGLDGALAQAAAWIAGADGLVVAAGAGMGVDSGLPDFRGREGFWRAYPALGKAGIDFTRIANPQAFEEDPALAWGFYGHRLLRYRETRPHAGFAVLRRIGQALQESAWVVTSNVDGQFQKAGFSAGGIAELHGSIHHLQCSRPCSDAIWSAAGWQPGVDVERCRLINPPPRCPHCGALARPNILMFGDGQWIADRRDAQWSEYLAWRANLCNPVVVELGAGQAVATIRHFSERQRCPLIRINPREPEVHGQGVGIALGAAEALRRIEALLQRGSG